MMTGAEYRESLEDGRRVFLEGELIESLPDHPIYRIPVETAAALYDRGYDPTPGRVRETIKTLRSPADLREHAHKLEDADILLEVTSASIMTLLTAAGRIEAALPVVAWMIMVEIFSLMWATIENCGFSSDGSAFPDELYTNVGKYHGAARYNDMVRDLHDIAGGSVQTAPSVADLENKEVGGLIEKYMGTKEGIPGAYRTKLFHAIYDFTAGAHGSWQSIALLQSGGGLYAQRIVSRAHYDLERAKKLALESAHLEPPR